MAIDPGVGQNEPWTPRPLEKAPPERLTGESVIGDIPLPSWRPLARLWHRIRRRSLRGQNE